MGAVPSTPRNGSARPQETAEYLIGTFVGEKSVSLPSEFWQKLLAFPLDLHWPSHRVRQALQNNHYTGHLGKILIHLACCLLDCISAAGVSSTVYTKAVNAAYISSVFLKHIIENSKSDNIEELHLSLDEAETVPGGFPKDHGVENFLMHAVLGFIGNVDVSPITYHLHYELLNFMIVATSTQLLSGPSPGPEDVHPFIDAVMTQDTSLVASVVQRLLLNYIARPRSSWNSASYSIFSEGSEPSALQRVGSVAANIVLLPLNLFVDPNTESSRSLLAECSLHVLLILTHYRKCIIQNESIAESSDESATSDPSLKGSAYFIENPYCKALENARDVECS